MVAAIGIISNYAFIGKSLSARHYQEEEMDSRESAFWARLKANRWAYTFTILATLALEF